MRTRLVAASLLALLSSHAFAFDASKANRYPSPDMYRPNVDRLTINSPGSTGPIGTMNITPSLTGSATRVLNERAMDRYSTLDAGADASGSSDVAAAFGRGLSAARTFDVLPGSYSLGSANFSFNGVPFFHPGSSVTGAAAGAFALGSGARFWGWINPDTQSDNGTFYWHLPGHMMQRRLSKIVSGAPQGNGSDQHYAADFTFYQDDVLQPTSGDWYKVTAVNRWDLLGRGLLNAVRGTGVGSNTEVYVGDTVQDTNTPSGESEGSNQTIVAIPGRNNAGHNWWGGEINVMGSSTGPSRTIIGQSITVANPAPTVARDVTTDYRGVIGQSIVTAPGSGVLPARYGASWAGLTTSPLDRGLTIGGLSGAYDGANPVMTGNESFANYGMLVGLDIGGNYTPWSYQRPNNTGLGYWQSKLKEAQYIQRYTDTGLRIFNPHPSAIAGVRSLKIDAGAGTAELDVPTLIGGTSPTATFVDNGAPAGQKRVQFGMYQGLFYLQRQNDDGSFKSSALSIPADGSGITLNGKVNEPNPAPPASSTSPCTTGDHAWDANYDYRCVATNTWRRTASSAW